MPTIATIDEPGGLRVLVADDDPDEQLLLAAAAQGLGDDHEISFVDDGRELLDELCRLADADDLPDLVVLDLRMPRMDGHQALDEVARHPVLWQVPVLVWTTSTDPHEADRCWGEGAVWFEHKPATFAGYIDLVRSFEARCAQARSTDAATIDLDAALASVLAQEIDLGEPADQADRRS